MEATQNIARIGIHTMYHKAENGFVVQSPCVNTSDKILKINEIYELYDSIDGRGSLRRIKLLYVFLRGFTFYICGIDIDSGEMIKRSLRLSNNNLPCSWIIGELFYFERNTDEEVIKAYCSKDNNCNSSPCTNDLLEFDY